MEIGDRVRILRAGRQQNDLCAAAGIDQSLWSQVETGKIANPTLRTLTRIAGALGVSLAELVDPEHAKNGSKP